MKSSIKLLLVLVLGIALLYIVPLFTDVEALIAEMESDINAGGDVEVKISRTYDMTLFPMPKLTLEKIAVVSKGVERSRLRGVTFSPGILQIIGGSITSSEAHIMQADIYIEDITHFSQQEGEANASLRERLLPLLSGVRADTVYVYADSGDAQQPHEIPMKEVSLELDSWQGPLELEGRLFDAFNKLDIPFTAEVDEWDDEAEFMLTARSPQSLYSVKGEYSPGAAGSTTAKLQATLGADSYFAVRYLKLLPQPLLPIYNDLVSQGAVNVSADISAGPGSVAVNALRLTSPAIDATTEAVWQLADQAATALDLDIKIASLTLAGEAPVQVPEEGSAEAQIKESQSVQQFRNEAKDANRNYRSVFTDMPTDITLSIDTLKYKQATVQGIQFQSVYNKGAIKLHSLYAIGLPGNSDIVVSQFQERAEDGSSSPRANASFKTSDMHALFSWLGYEKLLAEAKEPIVASLNTVLNFHENRITMPVVDIALADMRFRGQSVLDYTDGGQPSINSGLQIESLDINRMLGQPTIDTTIDWHTVNEFEDSRRFDFLRRLDPYFKVFGLRLQAGKVLLNATEYTEVDVQTAIAKNMIQVQSLSFISPVSGKNAISFSINSESLRPKVVASYAVDSFDINQLFVENREAGNEYASGQRAISFKRLGVADIALNFAVKECIFTDKIRVKNLTGVMDLGSERMNFTTLKGTIHEGFFDGKAVANNDFSSFSTSFTLINGSVAKLLSDWTPYSFATQGRVNISGAISAVGSDVEQWIDKLDGSLNIFARGVQLQGFNVPLLSAEVGQHRDIDRLRTIVAGALKSGTTPMDSITGVVEIDEGNMNFRKLVLSDGYLEDSFLNAMLSLKTQDINGRVDMKIRKRHKVNKDIFSGSFPLSGTFRGVLGESPIEWNTKPIEDDWAAEFYNRR